ncbi:hypothetical protein BC477_04590 [Clavibacter michiganensis subsp. michiganensis]|uniref:Uncharacterized protein n=1 Tax=Clavibacter michiganensis subsp. michiganensis TaxID=33013 RepID=A0A251XKI6_CLAMM|nr:hypothetical protein BC477_04590 [Clavibacter michiganensis subsp. michiganensis]OUE03991.1 hypothetical protein CMMCAS07_03520 [Clavibacter michiganensis subsp. michiganensis]
MTAASSAFAAFFVAFFFSGFSGTSTGAGVARMPSSRSRMTV